MLSDFGNLLQFVSSLFFLLNKVYFSTALKKATERDNPDESEERDLTMNRYDMMKRNRRKRTPELVWEQLLNSVGLGIFRVDSTQEQNDEEMMEEEMETDDDEGAPHVIRCRQM
jgi:hypothetical protein